MFLVSGGGLPDTGILDSTEIFDTDLGSWKAGAALPNIKQHLRATTIDNRVLLFGITNIYFLAPTGAQEMLMIVCSFVCLFVLSRAVNLLHSGSNLQAISQE